MLDVFGLTPARFETLILVLVRCLGMFGVLPVLGARQIPLQARFAIALIIALVIYRTVPTIHAFRSLDELGLAVLSQVVVGLFFGFVAYLVFMGIQFAGEIIDTQIGFGIANVLNPATQQQVTIIGELELGLATLIYLITDSHLQLIAAMGSSFDLLPLPWVALPENVEHAITSFFAQALLIVFKVAGPVAISLFLVNVGLALLARVAPQMNVFVVGFPLQIGIGLVMLIISLPLLAYGIPELFRGVPQQVDTVLRAMRPEP